MPAPTHHPTAHPKAAGTRLPRLAIVVTHPIQYYAPVFRTLAASGKLEVRVFFTWSQAADGPVFDSGFGATVAWDVPLLDGYDHQFVANVAQRPGLDHFFGLKTPSLLAEVSAWSPDAVLVYTWNSHSHVQAMRGFKGRTPVFFRGDSTLLDSRSWWRSCLRRAALRWVYRHVDVALAVGSNNSDYFAWCGLSSARIAVAPHSVDTLRFAADAALHEERASEWRRKLAIPADGLVILFAGKLQPKKNPLLLFEAFKQIDRDAHLVFVGNGELEGDLRSATRDHGRVHFLPFQNQTLMPAIYRLGDLFVLPSQGPEETWGLALNEAMACARPVVASTRVGGARDLIRSGETGWIFNSGNLEELRQVLQHALERGRDGLRIMGHAAQVYGEQFSTEESARRIAAAVLAHPMVRSGAA